LVLAVFVRDFLFLDAGHWEVEKAGSTDGYFQGPETTKKKIRRLLIYESGEIWKRRYVI